MVARALRMTALLALSCVALCPPARAQSGSRRTGTRVPAQSSALRGASQRSPGTFLATRSQPMLAPRGETVSLPYNMVWGDPQQRLSSLFAGVGAKVTNKKADGPTEVWTVQGLIAPDLQASLFTFQQGLLVAMEFDYGQTEWDLPKYNEKMGSFRRLLEAKCGGPGEMVSRDTTQEPDSTIKQTLMGYQWTKGDTLVQLFYFSAEDTAKAMNFRTISIHYHFKDPYQEQQAMPENGAPVDPGSNPLFGGSSGGGVKPGGATTAASPAPTPEASPTASPGDKPAAKSSENDPLPER